jgi:hypothetical protein
MLSWSSPRRKRDRAGHPDHPGILVGAAIDPAEPATVVLVFAPGKRAPYAEPDHVQEPGVLYPTAVYKPWIPNRIWEGCIIVTEEDDDQG